MINLKTEVSIYFKNRINNVKRIVIKSSGISYIHFDSKIANVIDLSKEEALKFLNEILKLGAQIERLKVRVNIDC